MPASAIEAIWLQRWNAGENIGEQLDALKRKPVLFIMMNSTEDAEDVGAWLRERIRRILPDKTQIIHTDKSGEVSKKDLDMARKAVREVDDRKPDSRHCQRADAARRMGREERDRGCWGCVPYTAKANILPEQAIGRGLRLMFRDVPVGFTEARGHHRKSEISRLC